MIKEIETGSGKNKRTILFDTELLYSGKEPSSDIEKDARRALNLPITKQLVYYPNININQTIDVEEYGITEVYDEWYTVKIKLADGVEKMIHSAYLKEMQSPSFIADMKKQV